MAGTVDEAFAALDAALRVAGDDCPDDLLELCRARIRMLLGRPAAEPDAAPAFHALARYADSPLFTPLQRAALEFTEHYVLDVASLPAQLVERLTEHLGAAGTYGFVMALYAADQAERLALTADLRAGLP